MKQNEQGFTLLESLFVLSIFMIISSLSILLLKPHDHLLEEQLFFSQLKADLLYAQQYALTNQEQLFVAFDDLNYYYYIRNSKREAIVIRSFPEKITVAPASLRLNFYYNSKGNISSFGSIYIYIEDQRYRMTFLIGKGRFYVVKE